MKKKPVKKFRLGQLVEYRPAGSKEPWSPTKITSWSHDADDGFVTYFLKNGCVADESELRLPKLESKFKVGDKVEGNLNGEPAVVKKVDGDQVTVKWKAKSLGTTVENASDLDLI